MENKFNSLSIQHDAQLPDRTFHQFYTHASARRVSTDAVLVETIRLQHHGLQVSTVPQQSADLLAFAQGSGRASYEAVVNPLDPMTEPLTWRTYVPPTTRLDGERGFLATQIKFGKFSYKFDDKEYIIYVSEARDGTAYFPALMQQYIVHGPDANSKSGVERLIRDAGEWSNTLHGEIWVFDQGFWQKESDLWKSIMKSRWEDVILEGAEKDDLRKDVKRFYDSQAKYEKYRIAWKRGVIYYGPPGNGKTVSIKALSHELYSRDQPIPTLYVKTLTSFGGPEYSVKLIFAKARAEAPCLLVFEDLDSLITDQVRSYFLNEIDGLSANQGVYMIGSTNHIDRLDPGISRRPSRFDRKFRFPKPSEEQRTIYCEYWRQKLKKSEEDDSNTGNHHHHHHHQQDEIDDDDLVHVDANELEFPKELCPEIAKITDGFSFAYLQEAFVASLLIIVSGGQDGGGDDDNDDDDHNDDDNVAKKKKKTQAFTSKDKFDDILFWRVIKQQVALLKGQI